MLEDLESSSPKLFMNVMHGIKKIKKDRFFIIDFEDEFKKRKFTHSNFYNHFSLPVYCLSKRFKALGESFWS